MRHHPFRCLTFAWLSPVWSLPTLVFCVQDDYAGYEEVKKALAGSGILTTTAEHEYTRSVHRFDAMR